MKINDILQLLQSNGLAASWLNEANGRAMCAVLTDGTTLDLSVDAAVVLPDVHLGIGAGDPFQESDPSRTTRLEQFLGVLTTVRDTMPAGRFAAVQLGDFFDVMRTPNPAASFTTRLGVVMAAYPEVMRLASALPLLHCIGNHDHEIWNNAAAVNALGISAHVSRALGPGVLASHGNDLVSLENIQLDDAFERWLLSLVQSLIDMPVLGPAVAALQRVFDETLQDPIFSQPNATSLPWPPAAAGANVPSNWAAPWVLRDNAAQLGVPLYGWEQAVQPDLALAIIGHSHRPGISWTTLAVGQQIPLVDVGSWTYGRSNFAIVGSDGVGIAQVGA